jgi:hypothetical protein
MKKKMSLEEMVKKIDDAKKVNPLDLSSDQDLSIALMNLVSLEEHFFFSGAKTKKPGFYDLINVVRNMRKELMERIVNKNQHDGAEVWCISKHLLAAAMRLYEVGTKALGVGNKKDAYQMFEKAYELYSLFWGLNMNMIDLTGVQEMEPEFYNSVMKKSGNKDSTPVKTEITEARSTIKKLGDWVKSKVNCCIE